MTYTDWKNKVDKFRKIDVRGVVGNFFQGLKKQVSKLPQGEGVTIIQSFEPIPLYEVMEDLGFEHHTKQVSKTEFHTHFYKAKIGRAHV